jgi:hypothetical protein
MNVSTCAIKSPPSGAIDAGCAIHDFPLGAGQWRTSVFASLTCAIERQWRIV